MANKKSAIKRIRTNERNRQRNIAVKSRVKTHMKQALEAIEAKDAAKVGEVLPVALSEIDRAVSKGVLHKKTAGRKKSILQRGAGSIG